MTNQEAIKELSEWLDSCCGGEEIEPTRQALRLAISALQAQELSKNSQKLDSGNGDCISRAAAMTAIQMIAERYTLAHEKMGDGRVEWSEYLVRMSDAFDVIRDLQSVEPYQEEIEIMTYPQVPGITPTVI